MGLSRERRLEGIRGRQTRMWRWPLGFLRVARGARAPRTRGLFFKARIPQRCGGLRKPTQVPSERKKSQVQKMQTPYQNIHLQRLMLEKPRNDRGERR